MMKNAGNTLVITLCKPQHVMDPNKVQRMHHKWKWKVAVAFSKTLENATATVFFGFTYNLKSYGNSKKCGGKKSLSMLIAYELIKKVISSSWNTLELN